MSFFTLSDGTTAQSDGNMEMGGGSFDPIPSDTNVLAMITDSRNVSYEGETYISNTWTILAPAEYKNRKIFQKLRVYDSDPAKKDKALRMLAAIDANCGGKLVSSGLEPTDHLLSSSILQKPMVCNLQIWEINGKTGNWISAVSPRKKDQEQNSAPQPATAKPEQPGGGKSQDDFDLPF